MGMCCDDQRCQHRQPVGNRVQPQIPGGFLPVIAAGKGDQYSYHAAVRNDGDARIEETINQSGDHAGRRRKRLKQIPPDRQEREVHNYGKNEQPRPFMTADVEPQIARARV